MLIRIKKDFDAKFVLYNRPALIGIDPISIPRLFNNKQDIEIDALFTEKFTWGNMNTDKPVYLDENTLRMTTNLRLQLATLADGLIDEGRKNDAKKVLDLTMEKMPEKNVPYDRIMLPIIEAYYNAGDSSSANAISERLFTIMEENMNFYLSLEPKDAAKVMDDMNLTNMVMERMVQATGMVHKQQPLGAQLLDRYSVLDTLYQEKLEAIANQGRRTTKAKF